MNISPIVNSVKCTFFACIVHFLHVLEGSTAIGFTTYVVEMYIYNLEFMSKFDLNYCIRY